MEAQACSRPVITSNVIGCKDAIIDNETGYLVEPMSVDGLVNKMEKFINDPELIKQMGEAAYQHALKNPSKRRVLKFSLPHQDSNLEYLNQNQVCCHYTMGQKRAQR